MTNKKLTLIAVGIAILMMSVSVAAQTTDDLQALKKQVAVLLEANKYTDALPLLEKIVAVEPNDGETQFQFGFALLGQATVTKDAAPRKALRIRARAAFVKAKELGVGKPVVEALISSISPDGADGGNFSKNVIANSLMMEAEAFFSQGKLDEALADYKKALEADPKVYHAALFAGDVFVQKREYEQALSWYDRAIAIDPTIETGYRYSATPLMKQGKTEAARDRYIEAFITEPYNKFARAGLIQWGEATGTQLGHPEIKIPTNVSFDEKGNANINLDASSLLGAQKDDGSFAWLLYGTARATWRKEKFAKQFPQESTYRHSLSEEADALRSVILVVTSDKKIKNLEPSLAKLKKLNDEGLLESYILLAIPDQGIAADHPAYLKENRDKLRRYMVTYVANGGGN